jgi:hypothetical protein
MPFRKNETMSDDGRIPLATGVHIEAIQFAFSHIEDHSP